MAAQPMNFTASRTGAALTAGWAGAAGGLALFFLLPLPGGTRLLAALGWAALCLGGLSARLASCRVRVGGNHLTVRTGTLFPVTKRIPLRFITGTRMVQTPLGRAAGVCLMLLYGSGTWTVLAGVRCRDAEALAAQLGHGGKLL